MSKAVNRAKGTPGAVLADASAAGNGNGTPAVLRRHAEDQFAEELAALARADNRARPPRWRLSPWAVSTYLLGGTLDDGFVITPKYIGNRRLIEIAVSTLATDRALLLLGVPGTAKSWVSEHLAAAINAHRFDQAGLGPGGYAGFGDVHQLCQRARGVESIVVGRRRRAEQACEFGFIDQSPRRHGHGLAAGQQRDRPAGQIVWSQVGRNAQEAVHRCQQIGWPERTILRHGPFGVAGTDYLAMA